MVDDGTAEERVGENVILHENGIADTPDHLQQSSAATKNAIRRKKTTLPKTPAYRLPLIIIGFLIFTSFVTLTLNHFYSIYAVSGPSMEPTFSSGQVVVLENSETPKRRGIILFHKPSTWPHFNDETDLLIKRLYGLPGDTLEIKDEKLFINGEIVSDLPPEYECKIKTYTHKLSDREYFVMGDNALQSLDSKRVLCNGLGDVGFVDKEKAVGYGNVVAKF